MSGGSLPVSLTSIQSFLKSTIEAQGITVPATEVFMALETLVDRYGLTGQRCEWSG